MNWEASAKRRALSASMPHVEWPPAVGARIHYNSGWAETSWTAEVRAIVDGEVAVLWQTCPLAGRSNWEFLTRIQVDVWREILRVGPLPKALTREVK